MGEFWNKIEKFRVEPNYEQKAELIENVMACIFERYFFPLYKSVLHLCDNDHFASEDIVQEAFIVFLQNIEEFEGDSWGQIWCYLKITAYRIAYRWRSKNKNTTYLDEHQVSNKEDISCEIFELLTEALGTNGADLNLKERNVMKLWLEGKDYQEISSISKMEVGNVRTTLCRARKKLIKFFEERGIID